MKIVVIGDIVDETVSLNMLHYHHNDNNSNNSRSTENGVPHLAL